MRVKAYHIGGALLADSDAYVERPSDAEARLHLRNMDYITLFEPRQQGKTSLINRLIGSFSGMGYVFAYVDLSTVERRTEEGWYSSLCHWILRQIGEKSIDTTNIEIALDGNSWRNFLADLADRFRLLSKNLVIALDEVGAMPQDWATSFFSTIRSVYNSRQTILAFRHVTFIVAGAYNPKDLISDPAVSNFNVDHRVHLPDFTSNEIEGLLRIVDLYSEQDILPLAIRVHNWTNGQPFMTQQVCALLSKSDDPSSPAVLDSCVTTFIHNDTRHIPGVISHLRADGQIFRYARRIVEADTKFSPGLNEWHFKLANVIGYIRGDSSGYCRIRNRIYETVTTVFLDEIMSDSRSLDRESPVKNRKEAAMGLIVRILHISDFHERGPREKEPYLRTHVFGENWDKNLDKILEGGPIDLVCMTGDVAQGGKSDEYQNVTEFIRNLTFRLGVSFDKIFIVPGNHDIDRGVNVRAWKSMRKVSPMVNSLDLSRWMAGVAPMPPPGVTHTWKEKVLARQAAFWKWLSIDLGRMDLLPARSPHGSLGFRQTIALPGGRRSMHIVGLDTAWLAGDESDSTNLLVTTHQLYSLLSNPDGSPLDGLRIVLMHHPISDLADRSEVTRILSERADLVLRGHLHEPDATCWVDADQRKLPQLAAGCLYEGHAASKYPNGIQVITLCLDDAGSQIEGELYFRTWSSRGHWYDDNSLYRATHNGKIKWTIG